MTSTRRYFDRHARSFDRLYAGGAVLPLRRGPRLGRELAVSIVTRHPGAAVLDVGCGPGRVGEAVLDAGASRYVGIDLSPRMLELAGERLAPFDGVELLEGDLLDLDVRDRFDVVLALGLFEYLVEPGRAAAWVHARCSSALVASFTRWDWVKGPLRHARYGIQRCPLVDYTEADARRLLLGAGFSSVELARSGRRGFLVVAGP